jgi:lipopolysaccharide/colanic/teichoic acid biosynthesis glycosyltransferase
VVLTTAGVTAAVWVVAVLTDSTEPHGLVLASALLAVVGLLVKQRRLADRVLAVLVGTLLLPVLLVIALAVRLSGPGPVVIRDGDPVSHDRAHPSLRFRTTTAVTRDGRSTAVGRLLRALSLDELPRLFDVVRGDLPLPRAGCR